MKNLSLLLLSLGLLGCHHNEFDVSPDQISKHHTAAGGPQVGGLPDFNHLPPGSVKHETNFKKGERLPDGQIAEKDMTVFQVQFPDGDGSKKGVINGGGNSAYGRGPGPGPGK